MVEYILLLAVITSISFAFYNNKRFKDLIKGQDGLFANMKKGMGYTYRYGIAVDKDSNVNFEEAYEFEYTSSKHDLYSKDGKSRFFSSDLNYP